MVCCKALYVVLVFSSVAHFCSISVNVSENIFPNCQKCDGVNEGSLLMLSCSPIATVFNQSQAVDLSNGHNDTYLTINTTRYDNEINITCRHPITQKAICYKLEIYCKYHAICIVTSFSNGM